MSTPEGTSPKFDPAKHARPFKQYNKQTGKNEYTPYLDVKWRVVWFRESYPSGDIRTSIIHHDEKSAVVFAEVSLPDGGGATAHGSETREDFKDYLEKAETKAVGRALSLLGFGAESVDDYDELLEVVQEPAQQSKSGPQQTKPTPKASEPQQGAKRATGAQNAASVRLATATEWSTIDNLARKLEYNQAMMTQLAVRLGIISAGETFVKNSPYPRESVQAVIKALSEDFEQAKPG